MSTRLTLTTYQEKCFQIKHDLLNLINPDHFGSIVSQNHATNRSRCEAGQLDNLNFDMLRFLLNIVSNTSWPPSVHAEPCFGQLVLLLSGLKSYLTFGESTVHLPAPISVKGNIVGWWWQLSWPATNSIVSSYVGFNLIDWGGLSFDGETWHCYFPPTLASWCRQTGVHTTYTGLDSKQCQWISFHLKSEIYSQCKWSKQSWMISLEVSIARFIDVLHSKAFVQHPLFPIVRLLVLQSQSRICNEHTSSGRGVPTKNTVVL